MPYYRDFPKGTLFTFDNDDSPSTKVVGQTVGDKESFRIVGALLPNGRALVVPEEERWSCEVRKCGSLAPVTILPADALAAPKLPTYATLLPGTLFTLTRGDTFVYARGYGNNARAQGVRKDGVLHMPEVVGPTWEVQDWAVVFPVEV